MMEKKGSREGSPLFVAAGYAPTTVADDQGYFTVQPE